MLRRSKILQAFAAAAFLLLSISTIWDLSKQEYARPNAGWLLQLSSDGDWVDVDLTSTLSSKGLSRRGGRRHLMSPNSTYPLPPLHIIQIGHPKTVTSYQFQIVCLSLFLKLESLGSEQYEHPTLGPMNAQDLLDHMECRSANPKHLDQKTPLVMKTHNPFTTRRLLTEANKNDENIWVFQTTSQDPSKFYRNARKAKVANRGYPNVMHILEAEISKEKGHDLIIEYAQIFGLDAARARELYEFIETWCILKVCCGKQMSSSWRNELLPVWSPSKRNATAFFPWLQQQQQPHVCSTYDINEVERTLMNMRLYQRLLSVGSWNGQLNEVLRLSPSDGDFSGIYCSSYNELVRTEMA
mmetsp:Transcript_45097/g.94575  ORF Transcript_45097/g.94575 Transcript_45097/m.94575 type:complete len:355 (+) Transcript_45097:64-1128(+)|eukprot:CAMPEP_0183724536 /NCGR_PEP_ID=MMETSP0737-20130205/17990_1 /TAXON_ID=385413 /ORGANISM="Thalassiosira miniscula, Strain CCMP1093" /LENGTH=354 /DNA_ID=CAMNT_0025955145 /DNA_START=32 /DNA_END=1096 /DNA_ORIENTATION=-